MVHTLHSGPFFPSINKRKYPRTTGGRASGKDARISIKNFPRTRFFTISQLIAKANGIFINVPTAAICNVSVKIFNISNVQ